MRKLDPARAKDIDKKNPRRLIRAIEIAEKLGKVPKVSAHPKYKVLKIGLTLPPEELRRRIRARLAARMRRGMIKEARHLHARGLSWIRMEGLGLEYRYLARYLRKKLSRTETEKQLETEIWHYAKRQMTWFKRDKNTAWFHPDDKKKLSVIKKFIFGEIASNKKAQP